MGNRVTRFAGTFLLAIALWSVAGVAAGTDGSYVLSAGQSAQIGSVDAMEAQFNQMGLQGVDEFIWVLGIDTNLATFPATLASPSRFGYWDRQGGAVERLTIVFATDTTVRNVVIDVAKGGAETLLIDSDGKTYTYTAKDIGSSEGLVPGVAELRLTDIMPGWHAFTLRLADDALGNGRSYIGAITVAAVE